MSYSTNMSVYYLYLEHNDLSRFVVEPKFNSLNAFLLEAKANLSVVLNFLGTSQNDHVGSLLSKVTQCTISPSTYFVMHIHPGPQVIYPAARTGVHDIIGTKYPYN